MGNPPKKSQNTRFSKFAQNSPAKDIHVKQKSIPPFLGIVSNKKWSPFLDLGDRSPIFLHPISMKKGRFSSEKYGTSDT